MNKTTVMFLKNREHMHLVVFAISFVRDYSWYDWRVPVDLSTSCAAVYHGLAGS